MRNANANANANSSMISAQTYTKVTIKDVCGRLETFHNVYLEMRNKFGSTYLAIISTNNQDRTIYYNPSNLIFIDPVES